MSKAKQNQDNAIPIELTGGNMNTPIRKGNVVYRKPNRSSDTIHQLLLHLKEKDIDWTPQFLGTAENGDEILSFIEGDVPHEMPLWIWDEAILQEVATAMRIFHDATVDFIPDNESWGLPANLPKEVICHNDFAPYNTVFKNRSFVGLIDFDVCSPGSRLWDISYTLYRFVPFMPQESFEPYDDYCHFPKEVMLKRTQLFLDYYADNESMHRYTLEELCDTLHKRLDTLAVWTFDFAKENENEALLRNSRMYQRHAQWVIDLKKNL